LLISQGTDVNAEDKNGFTSLFKATKEEMKAFLRKHGGHE
jgi:hypothetical protein